MFITKIAKRLHRGEKGFTLIELLVVLGILAVIVGLVMPNFFEIIPDARTTMIRGQHEKMREAVFSFYIDTGTFPHEHSNQSQSTSWNQLTWDPGLTGWNGPYLERTLVPNDWGGLTQVRYDNPAVFTWGEGGTGFNGYDFDIGGTPTPGNDSYLFLSDVPMAVCKALDKAIDGTTHVFNAGVVIYHDGDGDGDCNLAILLAD